MAINLLMAINTQILTDTLGFPYNELLVFPTVSPLGHGYSLLREK